MQIDLPQPRGDERLGVILRANVALEATVAVSVTIVYVTVISSPWVLLIIAVVALYGVSVWWAGRCNEQGRISAAIVWASVGYLPVGIVNALVAPFSLPLIALAALIPALLGVPYLGRRSMGIVTAVCFAFTTLLTVVASVSTLTDIEDRVPEGLRSLILVLGVPAISALLVLIQWQGHLMMADRTDDLERSERRLDDAVTAERARLERRLQGGVTKRLRQSMAMVERATADPARADAELAAASQELTAAVDQLRSLAQGLYPAVLVGHGLRRSLEALVERSGVPGVVEVVDRRFEPEVENAVYFTCAEAIDNTLAHAGGVAAVRIMVDVVGADLGFVIADDGVGFDVSDTERGSGLQLMTDRVLALGGTIEVRSTPGGGTAVVGALPLAGVGLTPFG